LRHQSYCAYKRDLDNPELRGALRDLTRRKIKGQAKLWEQYERMKPSNLLSLKEKMQGKLRGDMFLKERRIRERMAIVVKEYRLPCRDEIAFDEPTATSFTVTQTEPLKSTFQPSMEPSKEPSMPAT
jgi:hypothetical protein